MNQVLQGGGGGQRDGTPGTFPLPQFVQAEPLAAFGDWLVW